MGQNMGQLISRRGGNLRDIDIKNLTVSLIKKLRVNVTPGRIWSHLVTEPLTT